MAISLPFSITLFFLLLDGNILLWPKIKERPKWATVRSKWATLTQWVTNPSYLRGAWRHPGDPPVTFPSVTSRVSQDYFTYKSQFKHAGIECCTVLSLYFFRLQEARVAYFNTVHVTEHCTSVHIEASMPGKWLGLSPLYMCPLPPTHMAHQIYYKLLPLVPRKPHTLHYSEFLPICNFCKLFRHFIHTTTKTGLTDHLLFFDLPANYVRGKGFLKQKQNKQECKGITKRNTRGSFSDIMFMKFHTGYGVDAKLWMRSVTVWTRAKQIIHYQFWNCSLCHC